MPFELEPDLEDIAFKEEINAQHAVLAEFLKFKAQSKMLSRQFAQMTSGRHSAAPAIDTGSDTDDEQSMPSNKNQSAKRKKRHFQQPETGKVTFDFNGKIMNVKAPPNKERLINPDIRIPGAQSMSGLNSQMTNRSRSMKLGSVMSSRQSSTRFDPKKNLVTQF